MFIRAKPNKVHIGVVRRFVEGLQDVNVSQAHAHSTQLVAAQPLLRSVLSVLSCV